MSCGRGGKTSALLELQLPQVAPLKDLAWKLEGEIGYIKRFLVAHPRNQFLRPTPHTHLPLSFLSLFDAASLENAVNLIGYISTLGGFPSGCNM